MGSTILVYALAGGAALAILRKLQVRLRLSRAKHPSLQGHVRLGRWIARRLPYYEYGEQRFFRCDDAPEALAAQRRAGFERLVQYFREHAPQSVDLSHTLQSGVSDARFTNAYRVPFQFRRYVQSQLPVGTVVTASSGTRVQDLDGNWAYDLSGSYGVNVLGYDFYKECLARGVARAQALGPVLGSYHPVVADNVARLQRISGLDEVSFHMSGTEAVMQAVRLARYHTGRTHLVRFAGAYHGWWDGVQAGVGSQRPARDVYTLRDMDPASLKVLRTRKDIACVLVSPLQALHPNKAPPGDAALVNSERNAHFDHAAYSRWLHALRDVCSGRGIALIVDEVFSGFRLAYGGAQEHFGVEADLVTYGKSLGGGLPVGVLCGRRRLMNRFRDQRPADICFARGTFNAHPYAMTCMNEFLRRLDEPEVRNHYERVHAVWDTRTRALNDALCSRELPLRVANLASILTVLYTVPGRYNWLFQYYLRAQGLALPWTGTGRLIMSHDYSEADFDVVKERFVGAAQAMQADGWWWQSPGLTNRTIKRQVLGEMLAARLGRCPERPR
ncbi:MAG: aminotransferase class III-fold pyridoxal phosphate-dependent enzyme [Nitrococcus sp.]|nr:aminotransferase class III-fold pyridoxal phosphate-dependent enzyme [Nitrococcus sp.]